MEGKTVSGDLPAFVISTTDDARIYGPKEQGGTVLMIIYSEMKIDFHVKNSLL